MYLEKRSKNFKKKILNKLNEKSGNEELMYWRKVWIIHDWFCDRFNIENCKEQFLTKEDLIDLVIFLEIKEYKDDEDYKEYEKEEKTEGIKKLNKIIENIDWENEEVFYYAWW